MYLSSIEFPTASHKCEKTKNVIELACLSHTMKTGADSENSEIGVQNPCQLYRHCIYLFLKRIFFKSYIISQKGRWGMRSPWTTPKSTHGQVLIKARCLDLSSKWLFINCLILIAIFLVHVCSRNILGRIWYHTYIRTNSGPYFSHLFNWYSANLPWKHFQK